MTIALYNEWRKEIFGEDDHAKREINMSLIDFKCKYK